MSAMPLSGSNYGAPATPRQAIAVDGTAVDVNWSLEIMRYELSDYEWTAIKPMLPNKPHSVRRVNDHRVLNGIFLVLRSGAPWHDLPREL